MESKSDYEHVLATLNPTVRQMLAEDLPDQLGKTLEAFAAGEYALARQQVHAVHGSAAFCKLEELRQSAARLELSLDKNEKNAAHIRAFENSVRRILHALEHQEN